MSENCNVSSTEKFSTSAVVVVGPHESLSSALVQKFIYHSDDVVDLGNCFQSTLKDLRKLIRSSYIDFYGGKTLAVFLWNYDSSPLSDALFVKFIRIQNVREFKL